MSSQTTTSTTFPAFMPSYPPVSGYGFDDAVLLAAINSTDRNLTNEINASNKDLTKEITQTTLGLRDAVERGNVGNASTMERINSQLGTSIERNGLNVYGAVERVAGENRITTVTTDAATRQANNDLARDITAAVERNGSGNASAIHSTHAALLQSIERNSGESRTAAAALDSASQGRLADVRRDITNQVSDHASTLLTSVEKNGSDIRNEVANAAWEQRTGIVTGFSNVALEQAKNFSSLQLEQQKALYENSKNVAHMMGKVDNQFASTILESQKVKSDLENQASNHYSNLLLEQQRVKEYLSSKGDNHFAMNQLELQKVKSELASQASTNFAISQLEQAKLAAQISAQMADAKYEALKTQGTLSDKMMECCCEVKQKIDLVDRDRLRDENLANRFTDPYAFGPGVGPYGPYGGFGGRGQNGPGNGNGDVNIYGDYGRRRNRRHHSRSRSRSRSSSSGRSHR